MHIDTNAFLNRYKISRATLYIKMRDDIIPESAMIKGNGGSDINLFDQKICDALALDGKLGNKAKQAIMNLDDDREEHY